MSFEKLFTYRSLPIYTNRPGMFMDFQPKIAARPLKRLKLNRIIGWRANRGFCGLGFAQGSWVKARSNARGAARGARVERKAPRCLSGLRGAFPGKPRMC